MNIPLGVIALTLALLFMREPAPRQRVPIDIAGAVLVTTGFALILLALQQGGLAWSWGSWQSIGAISGGAACLLLCFHVERRTPVPIFDLGLFRNTTFNILCGVAFLTGGVFTGAVLFVPWFLQGVIGTSASAAGGALTPMMLMLLVVAVISGFLSKHVTYRAQFIAGFGLLALALLLMSGFSLTTSWLYIAVTTGVTGAGAGFILPLLNVSIQHAFPQERHAVVISTTTFARAFGAAAGMTLFLAIFNYFMTAQFDAAIGPFLASLPAPVASGFRANFADHPLNMIQLLINPAATSQLPPAFQAPMLQAIRTMFLNSAYPVYLFGLGGCALGIALAALLGTARTTVPIYRSEASSESAWSTK
jgi:MFS family permease